MVIGAGSASFRMLEDLVRRLPVMVTRWVDTRSQPVAIDDAVAYLDAAREVTSTGRTRSWRSEGRRAVVPGDDAAPR